MRHTLKTRHAIPDLHIWCRVTARRQLRPGLWRRVGRQLIRAALILLGLVAAGLVAGAIYVATLPSVSDAPVDHILAVHRAPAPRARPARGQPVRDPGRGQRRVPATAGLEVGA